MNVALDRRADLQANANDKRFVDYYASESKTDRARQRSLNILSAVLRKRADASLSTDRLDVGDIGCNAGTQSFCWLDQGHRVRGLDVSADLIAIAKERCNAFDGRAEFEVGTAERLPWPTESLDVVLMPELLEHVQDWRSCLNEAVRVLKAGGTLYVSTTNALCPVQQEFNLPAYSWYPKRLKSHFLKLATSTSPELVNYATYPAYHWFTPYSLERFLQPLGMTVLDRFDVIDTRKLGGTGKAVVSMAKRFRLVRFIGHVLIDGSSLVAHKQCIAQTNS